MIKNQMLLTATAVAALFAAFPSFSPSLYAIPFAPSYTAEAPEPTGAVNYRNVGQQAPVSHDYIKLSKWGHKHLDRILPPELRMCSVESAETTVRDLIDFILLNEQNEKPVTKWNPDFIDAVIVMCVKVGPYNLQNTELYNRMRCCRMSDNGATDYLDYRFTCAAIRDVDLMDDDSGVEIYKLAIFPADRYAQGDKYKKGMFCDIKADPDDESAAYASAAPSPRTPASSAKPDRDRKDSNAQRRDNVAPRRTGARYPQHASRYCRDQIKSHESLQLVAYQDGWSKDRRGRRIPLYSVGYGHNGVAKGTRITKREAERLFQEDVARCEVELKRMIDDTRDDGFQYTQEVFDALVDICYNIGAGNLRNTAFWRQVSAGGLRNKRTFDRVFGSLYCNTYVYYNGKRHPGLIDRRAKASKRIFDTRKTTAAL